MSRGTSPQKHASKVALLHYLMDIYRAEVHLIIVTLGSPDQLRSVPFLILFSATRQAHHQGPGEYSRRKTTTAKTALNNHGFSPCHLRSPWRLPKMRAGPWSLPRPMSAPQSPSVGQFLLQPLVMGDRDTHKSRMAANSTKPSRLTLGA